MPRFENLNPKSRDFKSRLGGCKIWRLTREEIAASDNLLFFHLSAIVASFSDIWHMDFFGTIRKVTSLFSCISSGAEK